jgi:hypothetical protein
MNRTPKGARCTRTSPISKQTHKLPSQTCVIWVPERSGYVAFLNTDSLRSVQHPAYACHLTEDDAEEMVLAVRDRLGFRAAIRPYYAATQA